MSQKLELLKKLEELGALRIEHENLVIKSKTYREESEVLSLVAMLEKDIKVLRYCSDRIDFIRKEMNSIMRRMEELKDIIDSEFSETLIRELTSNINLN